MDWDCKFQTIQNLITRKILGGALPLDLARGFWRPPEPQLTGKTSIPSRLPEPSEAVMIDKWNKIGLRKISRALVNRNTKKILNKNNKIKQKIYTFSFLSQPSSPRLQLNILKNLKISVDGDIARYIMHKTSKYFISVSATLRE